MLVHIKLIWNLRTENVSTVIKMFKLSQEITSNRYFYYLLQLTIFNKSSLHFAAPAVITLPSNIDFRMPYYCNILLSSRNSFSAEEASYIRGIRAYNNNKVTLCQAVCACMCVVGTESKLSS